MRANQPSRISFNILPNNSHNQIFYYSLMQQQCNRLLQRQLKIQINVDIEKQMVALPHFVRLMLCIYFQLLKKCTGKSQEQMVKEMLGKPQGVRMKLSLGQLIVKLIQRKLYYSQQSQSCFDQISYALFFKQSIFSNIISVIIQTAQIININQLLYFHQSILSNQYLINMPTHIYYLYDGGIFTIQSNKFKNKLVRLLLGLGKTLSGSQSLVTRNVEEFKRSKERVGLLEDSIKVAILGRSKENVVIVAQGITYGIFAGRQYIKKQEFICALLLKKADPLLHIVLDLVRAQLMLIQQTQFKNTYSQPTQATRANFYATQMNKILNKCPFNGNQRCTCKKCQCVRRNRESAKLSQQKKRNAMQQLLPLKQKISQLQKYNNGLKRKNNELQQQNMMLKQLLNQMKQHPIFKGLLMETIEPVSKILNNLI